MKEIKLHPGMGPAILSHLSRLAPLPDHGILAGQAVASAIDDLYGKGGGVYNDLDVFRRGPRRVTKKAVRDIACVMQTFPGLQQPHQGDNHYNALTRCLQAMASYEVSSVSRAGLINYVNCRSFDMEFTDDRRLLPMVPERLLASFDLNCVRVAVDLNTKRLAWLPDYQRFLATRQLEIACLQTPYHTLLRLLKKLAELPGVYADVDAAAEAAVAMSRSKRFEMLCSNTFVCRRFGEKLHQQAQATSHLWTPYFSLQEEPSTDGKSKLYSLEPKGDATAEAQAAVDALSVNSVHYAARAVYRVRRRHAAQATKRVAELLESTPAKSFVHRHAKQLGEDYVQGQFSATHAEVVNRYVTAHVELQGPLSGLTLDEQYRAVRDLQRVERVHGRAALAFARHTRVAYELSADQFEPMVRTKIEAMKTPFTIRPLDLPKLPAAWRLAGYRVEEMTRPLDLFQEGNDMHHCVGGYSTYIRNGESRILRIRTGKGVEQRSTVELKVSPVFRKHQHLPWQRGIPGGALWVAQHRGFANQFSDRSVEELHKAILAYVVPRINGSTADRLRWRYLKLASVNPIRAVKGFYFGKRWQFRWWLAKWFPKRPLVQRNYADLLGDDAIPF